ncbi:MAG TPA: transketolase family protein [Nitrososphaeria archaeon]|nr:transketolase family protein [Nitrososphaeria archaeon]
MVKPARPEPMSTREAYGRTLVELGRENPDIVVLDADLSSSTYTKLFAKEFPERFFNFGIAEANMMGVAAGLASCGKIVFASTFAIFATQRAYNQFRQSIAYPGLNVKVAASHGGVSVGEDGTSHHCIEDIAAMRVLPGVSVVVPADAVEAREAVRALVEHVGPAYLRLGRPKIPVLYEEDYGFEGEKFRFRLGEAVVLRDGDDVALIATGLMVWEALQAAEELEKQGIRAQVIDVHTIKPIDRDAILRAARKTGAVVTAEEHNIIGGLGSAVAEVLAEGYPVPMERVGVRDVWTESGPWRELLKKYGLTSLDIVEAARRVIERRE